jgi:hypothetical protein
MAEISESVGKEIYIRLSDEIKKYQGRQLTDKQKNRIGSLAEKAIALLTGARDSYKSIMDQDKVQEINSMLTPIQTNPLIKDARESFKKTNAGKDVSQTTNDDLVQLTSADELYQAIDYMYGGTDLQRQLKQVLDTWQQSSKSKVAMTSIQALVSGALLAIILIPLFTSQTIST